MPSYTPTMILSRGLLDPICQTFRLKSVTEEWAQLGKLVLDEGETLSSSRSSQWRAKSRVEEVLCSLQKRLRPRPRWQASVASGALWAKDWLASRGEFWVKFMWQVSYSTSAQQRQIQACSTDTHTHTHLPADLWAAEPGGGRQCHRFPVLFQGRDYQKKTGRQAATQWSHTSGWKILQVRRSDLVLSVLENQSK